ncbi:Reticulocyte-binding protein 2 homolog a OS=Plasmodium falciparum (isolate 3D7) GN=PF13_0198 PE=3 SV=1 [Rhizoctonia solani AG-1 IB]|uniref:Reticulocyte-binding protein 2 homolog a n=1 Tax=Thanatephorus cucumeris (strain AG1-IB / isolate 7/3/14) TaxID=1108050 RepID=A0A0B7F796_THACB|nr:Reticulocyte-binding protein 2 homolog a OS=Plasmodium falciparum (isolate 3D7) GN=PF13_0198 PE=3 SV=1 [Rhizoctonia solani AG-1 IB]
MASAIVNPLLAAEPYEEASEGPRSPASEKEMELYYAEQERLDMQRRMSKRQSRGKSWRHSFMRTNSDKKIDRPSSQVGSEGGEDHEHDHDRSPSPPGCEPACETAPPANLESRNAQSGRRPESMSVPAAPIRDQSRVPWHLRRYEIYQPPSFVARAPPRYYNLHLLSASARERLEREHAQSYATNRLPSLVSSGSVFSGVGSGNVGGSVRSSLSVRRPSVLAMSPHFGGSAGIAGLETITASPASTAVGLHSPSLDPMNALNAGPAASHRLSTWLKRPPASPRTSMQPIATDATDLMDGTDPFGGAWHHSSPYDAGEMVGGSPNTRSLAGPSSAPRKGPSPLSQSTSAINLTDTEPPLPDPPGSPDLLSGQRTKRKLSKRRSTSASRGGLTSLFTRKSSVDEDHADSGGRTSGLRGRSRPPLSPSSQSLAQTQGIAFPTDGAGAGTGAGTGAGSGTGEKRPRRKLSKRGRSTSRSSAASVDSSRSIETPIHSQFARELPRRPVRDVEIVELPSAKFPAQIPQSKSPPASQRQRPSSSQRPPSSSFQHHRPPSSQHHSAPDPPMSPLRGHAPPSVTTNKPHRERKLSAASINSFLSRITSRDKDKDKDKDPPRSASVQDNRKVPPHKLLNHVGKDHKSGNMFTRFARKLSLIRRRSVDVMGNPEHNSSRPSFTVERRQVTTPQPGLHRRATLDIAPSIYRTHTGEPHPAAQSSTNLGHTHTRSPSTNELFLPVDSQLRSSQLIKAQLSPPPRIPPDILPAGERGDRGDRASWRSVHPKVSARQPDPPYLPHLSTDDLLPPPPFQDDNKHPDSPHSIPKWGIATPKPAGPLLLGNGSVEEDGGEEESPVGVLAVVNPDAGSECEVESVGKEVAVYGTGIGRRESGYGRESGYAGKRRESAYGKEVAVYGQEKDVAVYEKDPPMDNLRALRAQLEAVTAASPEGRKHKELPTSPEGRRNKDLPTSPEARRNRETPTRRNRDLPSDPASGTRGKEGTKPLVVRKNASNSRSGSPDSAEWESPLKRGGRESPIKRGRESPVKRGRESPVKRNGRDKRDGSPVKPVRRSEPLKDHSMVNGADEQKSHGFRPIGMSAGMIGSTTSVDAIQGDDEFAAKATQEDPNARQRILRPRASTDSIAKIHAVTAKPSLQKIRVRVVSNPPPIEISKESSPVKEDTPVAPPAPERTKSSKNRPRSGYTGPESRHSAYGTATSDPSEVPSSPAGPRKRISTADPTSSRHGHSKSLDNSGSKLLDAKPISTPYMTPTDEHAPLHPFSEKPVMYQGIIPPPMPISVMHVQSMSPPPGPFADGPSKMVFADSKGAWLDSPPPMSPPPKAPYMNDEFSVSKEKLAAQGDFKKHHKRESTAESERERRRARDEAKDERARQRAEWERAEKERLDRVDRDRQERERARAERAERIERERREQERLEQERLERERLEQAEKERERAERERLRMIQRQKEEQERIERIARERDRERVEKERQERERLELEREQIERERAEAMRLEWERMERERLMDEEIRRREPPPLVQTNSNRRNRHEADGEREVIIVAKEGRKSRRRNPDDSRSTSPTSTNQPTRRQRSQTDAYVPPIASALPPPVQPSFEVIAGVPVLPHGTHVEVAHPFQPRPTSVNTIEAPSLKARDAWERDRLDKGQSVLVPGGQRAVIPDIGSPRPAPDPRQRQASANRGRTQTPLMSHSEPIVPAPPSKYGPSHSSYSIPTFPSRSHNPLPKPPVIDGPYPLRRPAYTNPNRQGRPSGSRNPLPEPPRA